MLLHSLSGALRITKGDGLRDALMFGIALTQAIGGALAYRAEMQPCIPTDLAQKRVKISGQPIAGGGSDCSVKVEISAGALLLGERDGGALDSPDVDRCSAHRRHPGQRGLENRSQFGDFNRIGSPHQRFGAATKPSRGLAHAELAALAQLGQRAPQLVPGNPELAGQIALGRKCAAARNTLAKLRQQSEVGRVSRWNTVSSHAGDYLTESTIFTFGCFKN